MDAFLMDKSIKEVTRFQKVYDAITRDIASTNL